MLKYRRFKYNSLLGVSSKYYFEKNVSLHETQCSMSRDHYNLRRDETPLVQVISYLKFSRSYLNEIAIDIVVNKFQILCSHFKFKTIIL